MRLALLGGVENQIENCGTSPHNLERGASIVQDKASTSANNSEALKTT